MEGKRWGFGAWFIAILVTGCAPKSPEPPAGTEEPGAAKPNPGSLVPTTIALDFSSVTDREARYVWRLSGSTSWNYSITNDSFVQLFNPIVPSQSKHRVEVTLRADRFKGKGMDVWVTRRHFGNGSESKSVMKYAGLPDMPLAKLIQVKVTRSVPLPIGKRLRLAEITIPQAEFASFDAVVLNDKGVSKTIDSQRLALEKGSHRFPNWRGKKGLNYVIGSSPATKIPLEIAVSDQVKEPLSPKEMRAELERRAPIPDGSKKL